ncbi:uncharacterized protein LOC128187705 isoform X36 [Crassostrea angulata]|uniref:uncharacterized protein LOC128187705 isoform X36 n=1 Tax=Magallana angulata TaxID=2784310 RepID=UPI0022B16FCD|nr:uncharacterized protein LOC128187705 isoform X36 [Crassostrea angulata]
MIMTQPKSCLRRTETSLSRYSDDVFSVTITPRGTPTSFRRSESSFALLKRSQPSSSLQFPKVEATNVNRDDKLKLSRLGQRIRRDPHRAISIDESPIMLLPKANVRNDYDIRASKRAFNVVADDELSTFHLSTVPLDREEIKSSRSVSRSSMKSRKSLQSETDSGFGSSLRRCVTFSELSLSRSTIARSLDDIEKSSELEDVNNNNLKNINMLDSLFGPLPETEDDGGHLDSFADVIPDPPKIRKKQKDNAEVEDQRCTLTETDVKRCHEQDCEICKGFASEHTRIQRYFGGVDQFLQWLYSKWGKKRTELLTYSRANYLSRGNRPKFCDIVRQKELHYRDEEDRSESSEYNYYRQQGHLLTRWRKHSNASKEGRGGTEGRPGSPTSTVDGTDNQPDPPKGKPSTKTDSKDDKKKTEPISVPSDRDGRQSPVQPPPSPEPLTPKEDPNKDAALLKSLREAEEEEERRRRALVKKEKKPIHRTRKPKEEMEEKVEPPKPATPPPPPQPIEDTVTLVQQWKNKDIKVDLEVPSLPTFEDKKKDKKEKRKAERHLVSQPKHETPPPKDPEPLVLRTPLEFPKEEEVDLDDLDDQLKQRLKNFDFNIMEMMGEDSPRKNVQKATWVTGRLALSQQSSRFTLPIDMARLEQMTPLDYVKNFCIIKRRRKKLYQDIFVKHKDKTGQIPFKDLEKALTMVLVNTLTSDDYKRIVELLDISDSTRVDVDGFSAMAALAERLMCSTHVSQEQVDQPDYQKEKIECADFSALEWKLTGVQVNPKIVRILKELN